MLDPRDIPKTGRSFRFHRLIPLTNVLLCFGLEMRASESTDRASFFVQSALRSEIDSDSDDRRRLLDEALSLDPNHSEAHWARGEVRINGHWMSLEQAAAEASTRANLHQYRDLRRKADASAQGQAHMADFCRRHHLPLQERVHWNAVLALVPDNPQARQRLGFVNQQGSWVDERDLNRQKKTARESAEYLQSHGRGLAKLAHALYDHSLSRGQVAAELAEYRNPLVIPGLEYHFSSRGETGALCAVETLGSLPAPQASLSLVRHALGVSVESVRIAATDALKQRDEHSFIPALLASLQSPVITRDEFRFAEGNLLIWRQSFLIDMRDKQQMATLDRVFSLQGAIPEAANITANMARETIAARNLELGQLNAAIESYNDLVGALLVKVTRTERNRSPEEWWTWWNDRIESYPSERKEVESRYQRTDEFVVALPQMPRLSSDSTGNPSIRSARQECLAPGTPVWTETGPVAIDLLKAGDLVLAQNARSGELKFAAVLSATNRPPELLIRLKLGNETVRATGGHPFWVAGQGWIKTRSLKSGMRLHTVRGVAVLDSVEEEFELTKAFNLIIDDGHSYFVGTSMILSHDNTVRDPVANRIPGLREDIATNRVQ